MPLPRLRPLDASRVRVNGREMICLRDPEGIVEDPVLVPPGTMRIASMLDGSSEMVDLQAAYARGTGGELLFSWDVQQIVEELDRHGLLLTDRFEARRREIEAAFRSSPVRPAYHAGKAYPADPQALARDLDGYLRAVDAAEIAGFSPRGAIAPHIDFSRGGRCYAWAHRALAAALPEPETVLILGVAHNGPDAPFILTAKPFETPLGVVPVDQDLVGLLSSRIEGATAHEMAHRHEHSIEFQVVFLQHVWADRPVTVVPVLCSAFERYAPDGSPASIDVVEQFIGAVRGYIAGGRTVSILASVDFSHVGPRFGDREPADNALAARTSLGDRPVLEAILRGDAEAFWREVMAEGNARRIDAASAVYTALRILEPCHGRLLRYGQAPDSAGGIVSFASIALQ
jgi:AmmeMemoRadiSam system protein B